MYKKNNFKYLNNKNFKYLSSKDKKNNHLLSDEQDEQLDYQVSKSIEIEENRIYFYCPVGDQEALELNRLIKRLDVDMQYLSMRLGCGEVPIHLHIHSPGGCIFAGLSIVDTMRRCKTPIYTYIEGSAASAATFIAVCGTKGHRYIGKNSFMLVHQPQIEWYGKLDEFHDEIKNQKEIYDKILKIYLDNTKFEKEELEKLLQHELWLNADTCLEKGLIDQII
jgi:ATP-dependent Clp endopeptidase proteolytic subunit ClpP